MKNKLLLFAATSILLAAPRVSHAQTINIGSTANYVLFSSDGPLSNTGTSYLTGDVGTNNGSNTNFSGVVGMLHSMDVSTALCASDLALLYGQLNTMTATLLPLPILGNGQILTAGAYSITTAATQNGTLIFDAQGNPNAVFVIQIQGAYSPNSSAVVTLSNGALACNIYYKVEGAINVGSGANLKGNYISNNGFIGLGVGVLLEGRAMTTAGALAVNGVTAYIPTCSSPSPSIITQPVSQTVCAGSSISFSVSAVGAGLTYQWRKGLVNLVNGGVISGATSSVLTINPSDPSDNAANYNVLVNGTSLPGVVSINVSLLVLDATALITPPSSQTVCEGNSVTFSVTATGDALTYQWRNGLVNLINGGNISGANSAILVINPVSLLDASFDYNVIIAGTCSPNIVSTNVSLVVNTVPIISGSPVSQTVCNGSSINFSVTATGSGLTYQWRKGLVNLLNSGSVSGVNNSVLNINPVNILDVSSDYNVVITGLCVPSLTSANVSLSVLNSASITTQAMSQTVCAGNNVIFSVVATGSGLTYQWRNGLINLVNGGSITGANSSNLSIMGVVPGDASNNYNVVVTGSCLPAAISLPAALVVNTSPSITAQALSQTLCAGSTANFQITASGSGLIYQWRKGLVNLTNGGNVSGANTSQLSLSNISVSDAATNYNVVITGICTPSIISVNITLGISTAPVILSSPASQTVCSGSPAHFIVVATGSGLMYQWRKGLININNGGLISGATSSVLTISSVSLSDNAPDYNVLITGLCTPFPSSANASLLVRVAPLIVTQPLSQTVCAGSSATFSVVANGTNLNYQWRIGTINLNNGNNISGANTSVLVINPSNSSNASQNYNVVVSGYCLPNQISSSVALVLNERPTVTQQQGTQKVCVGSTASFTVQTQGTGLTYQWRKGNVNLINGGNISGATSSNLVISPVNLSDASANYNVIITGMCAPSFTSSNMALFVNSAPVITTQPNNQMAYLGGSASFTVFATGSELTYQWRRGTVDLINNATLSGATSSVLTISPVMAKDTAGNYNVVVKGVCGQSLISNNAILWVCLCENPTSLNEEVLIDEVKVFPNPFFNSINVIINETSTMSNCTIILYNMIGVEVLRSSITKTLTVLETSQLVAGAYSYQILFEDRIIKKGTLVSQH